MADKNQYNDITPISSGSTYGSEINTAAVPVGGSNQTGKILPSWGRQVLQNPSMNLAISPLADSWNSAA